jgi:hypothetical protein
MYYWNRYQHLELARGPQTEDFFVASLPGTFEWTGAVCNRSCTVTADLDKRKMCGFFFFSGIGVSDPS